MTATRARRTESEPVRRAQLLRAARKVFRAKGYEGATVSEIVREAGVAQGTFYHYFPSKRDAAVSLRDGLMETMAQAVATAVESRTSFEDRLESLIAASFKVARRNADLFRLAFIGTDETHPELHSESPEHAPFLSPNPPKDTDGRREDSGRVGEGATGEMAGLHWGRLEVGGRSSVAA